MVSAKLFDGKKKTTVTYTYDGNGNLISEIGAYGTEQVETYYDYTVENRLQAVYDAEELLMAAAYDGDGNRVFQLYCRPPGFTVLHSFIHLAGALQSGLMLKM